MKTIVNYPTNALLWHLYNNCGLNECAVNGIIEQINKLNKGKITLEDECRTGSGVTMADMLDDLHIDYETPFALH